MNAAPTTTSEARPRTLAEKVWDDHLVVKGENGEPDLIYIDLHLVHEVTSPQAFDGLRAGGPPGAPPRPHDRDRGPQHPDARHRQADRRPHEPHADRDAAPQRRGVRRPPALARRHRAGHRPRRRPAARAHACRASPSSAATRTPRTHGAFGAMAFGIGTSEVEHVLATQTLPLKPFKTMAITVEGDAAARRHREGHHPRRHREDRHRRRAGLRARVPRQRHPRALDGGPHDDLQHVDRGGRPRGHGRAGRDDLRLPRRAAPTPRRAQDWDDAVAYWRHAPHRRGRRLRRRGLPRRRTSSSRSSRGARTPARASRSATSCPTRPTIADPQRARRRRARARVHGPRRRARR